MMFSISSVRSEWIVHYESKIQLEIKSRLDNLKAFLEDYAADAEQASGGYPAEASHRTIIHHLQQEAENLDLWDEDFDESLAKLDEQLQGILESGQSKFVWADVLESLYPHDVFWWLYGQPAD